ncbi:hypothetical protein HMN09_01156400 [Mycena chlorophos]|uniref:Uncharacterized protein n=1 Tax=Mycena chlorophos TaxID=658473 RepID=A0A8H6S8I2_MYCCL|nr:hypothetical protein HMN09_01156400 [Mycena chlorophos]
MIVVEPDPKGSAPGPSAAPVRGSSPPPPYVGGSTSIPSQGRNPELPSAFRPPSPSSFPHAHPHTNTTSSGPTPLLRSAQATTPDGQYAYYDPRSAYSLAQADRRAQERFWSAVGAAMGIIVFLWLIGLVRFGH